MRDLEQVLLRDHDGRPDSKPYTPADLRAWIAGKDRSGLGMVSFADFKLHFQQ
jgi:hypothetical protein